MGVRRITLAEFSLNKYFLFILVKNHFMTLDGMVTVSNGTVRLDEYNGNGAVIETSIENFASEF
jgi:hypothetical protein